MTAEEMPNLDTGILDELLLRPDGFVRLLPAKAWAEIPLPLLRVWCHKRARYGIVTQELIDWLKPYVVPDATIELGAGMGDLGFHLGILMTDSRMQETPEMRLYYAMLGSPITVPPPQVRKMDADLAVIKYKPRVAIASWLTQKFEKGDEENKIGSSVYGADERLIIHAVDTYIHIGNWGSHRDKRAFQLPNTVHHFPWLYSRSKNQDDNFIAVWKKPDDSKIMETWL